jgi:hypothetical protein
MERKLTIRLPANYSNFRRALTWRDGQYKNATRPEIDAVVEALPRNDYGTLTRQYLEGMSVRALSTETGLKEDYIRSLFSLAADTIAGAAGGTEDHTEMSPVEVSPTAKTKVRHVAKAAVRTVVAAPEPVGVPQYYGEDWGRFMECSSDPDLFVSGSRSDIDQAKQKCGVCAVRAVCLEDALESGQNGPADGVRGGLTPAERRKLVKKK